MRERNGGQHPSGSQPDERPGLIPEGDEARVRGLRIVPPDSYPDWEAIYLDNVERLYRLMYSKVGNRPDAEDLTAEVFQAALVPLRVTVSGVNLKLTMPTCTVPAETAGNACGEVPEPTCAIWPAGIAIGISEAGALVAGRVP